LNRKGILIILFTLVFVMSSVMPMISYSACLQYEPTGDGGFAPQAVSGASFYPLPEDLEYDAGPGLFTTDLVLREEHERNQTAEYVKIGKTEVFNTRETIVASIDTEDGWKLTHVYIYLGYDPVPVVLEGDTSMSVSESGTLKIGEFPYQEKLSEPATHYEIELSLEEAFDFTWGKWDRENRVWNVSVYAKVVKETAGADGMKTTRHDDACALGFNETPSKWGWWTRYLLVHPESGHLFDSPVSGADFSTPTHQGKTAEGGSFDYIPGELVTFSLGSLNLGTVVGQHKITPLDLLGSDTSSDVRVINMARILQSLDDDQNPRQGITITQRGTDSLEAAMAEMGMAELDYSSSETVGALIDLTVEKHNQGSVTLLKSVSMDEAKQNLDKSLESDIVRKNISKTSEYLNEKAKIEMMMGYVPAKKANGESVTIEYYDEPEPDVFTLYDSSDVAKPLISAYTEVQPDTDAADIIVGISLDEGMTWKTKNISKSANRSSFTLKNGYEYPGNCKKPQIKVKDNYILVVWTSTYARTGQPRYAISLADDYPYDDPYYEEDTFGVAGPQRSVDYASQDFPQVGEIPFSAVWAARGVIDKTTGDVTWFKAERLTSGRRDANQIMMNGVPGAGFAITWQEDPEGLRPGQEAGPGEGWSGATTNHKTDIWYAYIPWEDFALIDENFESKGKMSHSGTYTEEVTRPQPLVPFTMPVRISDNDVVNLDNIKGTFDSASGTWDLERDENGRYLGTHSYGALVPGLVDFSGDDWLYEKTSHNEDPKSVFVTADGRLLDGNTGASRPNIMMQKYTYKEGEITKTSAYAVIVYEETKGVGSGPPEREDTDNTKDGEKGTGEGQGDGDSRYFPDNGKNVIFHTFDFKNPDLVSAGEIINPQVTDELGNPVYLEDETGNPLYDYKGDLIPAYENARRPRIILQPKSSAVANEAKRGTTMVCVFKMGEEGQGRPSDIFMRRWEVSATDPGNPYATDYMLDELQNLSSVSVLSTAVNQDSQSTLEDKGKRDPVKVIGWEQTAENLTDTSMLNPYDDARAHRGFLKGDFLALAYDWTPNWAAARNGNDHYDLFVRRSFDGGATWTTDPEQVGELSYETIRTRKDPNSEETGISLVKELITLGPGEYEPARNLSLLANHKTSVIEPRLVGPPSSIPGDILQRHDTIDPSAFWVTYGIESNPTKISGEVGMPLDLYYSYSKDFGTTYYTETHEIKPESSGHHAGETVERWDWLAKDTGQKEAAQAEAQIRFTPDGSIFYAVYNETGPEGSDVIFRRIMRDGGMIAVISNETVLDTEPPQITVSGVTEDEISAGDVALTISLSEPGTWTGELFLEGSVIDTFSSEDPEPYVIEARDQTDHYHLKVEALDTAGNRNRKGMDFTLDKRVPRITLTGIEDGAVTTESPTLYFEASGDETLVILTRDALVIDGFASGDTLSEEGVYHLWIQSTHLSSGLEAEKAIHFTIDKSAPAITVSGVRDGGKYYPKVSPVITITDRYTDATFLQKTFLLNGVPYTPGRIIDEIGRYTLEIRAVDLAGLTAEKSLAFTIEKTSSGRSTAPEALPGEDLVPLGIFEEETWSLEETLLDGGRFRIQLPEDSLTLTVPPAYLGNTLRITRVILDQEGPGSDLVSEDIYLIEMSDKAGEPVHELEEPIGFEYRTEKTLEGSNPYLCYLDNPTGKWIPLPTQVDFVGKVLTSTTRHLSDFAFVNLPGFRSYSDIEDHWVENDVMKFTRLDILRGDTQGHFNPDDFMTREEFIAFGMRLISSEGENQYPTGFADESLIGDWARPAVSAAVGSGIIKGFEDNTLRPKSTVTQAEVITILGRLYEMKQNTSMTPPRTHLPTVPLWSESAVALAARAGLLYEDTGVSQPLTRAQIVRISMGFFDNYFNGF